jgi:hypothetical protein
MVTPAVKREAVAHLKAHFGLSERRACQIAGADRKMVRYQSQRAPDTALRGRLRDLANERRRFGYRRLFVLLRREGEASGINRIYRLYREEGLTVRKRKARRKALGTRAPILIEARANARWSLDFVHDQFACGRRFRVLNVVDDVTRECLAAIPDTSISGRRVARELTALIERRGKPGMIVSDNGTELTSNAILTDVAGEDDDVLHGGSPEFPLKGPSLRQDPAEACRETSARLGLDQPETSEGPGWRGQDALRPTRPGQELGLRAGNRTGLGDCPSKGRCLSRITGGETQPGKRREYDHHVHPSPLPRSSLAARSLHDYACCIGSTGAPDA